MKILLTEIIILEAIVFEVSTYKKLHSRREIATLFEKWFISATMLFVLILTMIILVDIYCF